MHVITLTQPWATLIALGEKRVETRNRRLGDWAIGETLAIRAGQGLGPVGGERGYRRLLESDPFQRVLYEHNEQLAVEPNRLTLQGWPAAMARALPRGAVVAYGTILAVEPTENMERIFRANPFSFPRHDPDFGDYSPGRWAWILGAVHRVEPPLPGVPGNQAIARLDDAIEAEIVHRGIPIHDRPEPTQ